MTISEDNQKCVIFVEAKTYRVFIAEGEVALSVALGDFDSVVDVVNVNCVVGDVLNTT